MTSQKNNTEKPLFLSTRVGNYGYVFNRVNGKLPVNLFVRDASEKKI